MSPLMTFAQALCTVTLGVLIMWSVTCSACFIRNCPPGGKRGKELVEDIPNQRQCLSCGPGGLGQCIGTNICCGSSIGCFINTKESRACAQENDVSTPCSVDGAVCGVLRDGRCVSNGVCCTDEKCALDDECRSNRRPLVSDGNTTRMWSSLIARGATKRSWSRSDLLNYMQRILAEKGGAVYRRRR